MSPEGVYNYYNIQSHVNRLRRAGRLEEMKSEWGQLQRRILADHELTDTELAALYKVCCIETLSEDEGLCTEEDEQDADADDEEDIEPGEIKDDVLGDMAAGDAPPITTSFRRSNEPGVSCYLTIRKGDRELELRIATPKVCFSTQFLSYIISTLRCCRNLVKL